VDVEPIEGELVPYVPSPSAAVDLFGANDPVEVIASAQKVAQALRDVLTQQKLTQRIGQSDHVKVGGWTLLGSMLGVFPVVVWTHAIEGGWEARVEARTRSGEIVGAGEAMCTRAEKRWKAADEYALRSMAQTRAVSKALKVPLGFVVTLAGYNETPAEEVPATVHGAGSGASSPAEKITSAQNSKIAVLLKELEQKAPTQEGQMSYVDQLRADFGIRSRTELTKEQASEAIERLQGWLDAAEIPFG